MTEKLVNEYFLKEAKKELVFSCGGVDYYQFTEGGLPIYYNRFREFQATMNRHEEWKVTNEVFTEYLDMIQKFAKDTKLTAERKVAEIERITEFIKWRREQSNELMLVFELASVWYFDESEDPAEYSSEYAKEKIKNWQGNNNFAIIEGVKLESLLGFFLRTPLNKFINFMDLSEVGTMTYLRKLYETAYSHSLHNYLMLSEIEKGMNIGQNIESLKETHLGLIGLIDSELQNITTS